MNENTETSISLATAILIFISAASFALWGLVSQEQSTNNLPQVRANEDHRVFSTIQEVGEELYSGAQVIYSIFRIQEINADIEVEDILFTKNLTIDNTDVSHIDPNKSYSVVYERNTKGELTKIIFN
ncbi:hypothetical protein PUW24_00050 (plasmid) [Paenibacillus urinalis]|uniref:Uncharacterized protein n=1 Tax=Paenibacillus urinalis TaxID=521520 RepID=A0AAX3N9I1_9BACL|nr:MULTISPECIES: hypothetical protein [Paenibacillus]MCM3130501.1 hypothetical protein [Paenibacillus sp. MER 78]WDH85387.1 hypothetical protein PUW23_25460 [Paenibacillus urinalis]WDH95174.1 hypothetical protein PUW24_00050 [Paenibacillus urinalis]WDI05353.1 hypothetical protein PUW25_26540 [Paenibacillus urinalis]